jgi:hypothetical protein
MDRHVRVLATLVVVAALIAGCASDKGPAEAALKAAEATVDAAKVEAAKYVPDQVKGVEAALAAARDKFTKGDYKAALADAQGVESKAKELTAAATARKEELTKTWESLSAGLPKVVDAIKTRVDILSQSKKLPASVTKDALATAKAGLADLTAQWTTASEAFKAGNLLDAVTNGTEAKKKAAEVLTTLGMPVPDALKG